MLRRAQAWTFKHSHTGDSALMLAAREGHAAVVERLLEAGADKDAQGKTEA